MWIGAVTIFPEMFEAVTAYGITGRAVREGRVSFRAFNPRDYTHDRHRTVDDRPYGGGPGMVMKTEPLAQAIDEARAQADGAVRVLYLSPQGRLLDEQLVQELAAEPALILVSGRYEGVDERVLDSRVDDEISIGDYVLSGGELGAMVVLDAVARQLPGVLGHDQSAAEDSFADGLLDCPHYTRPEIFEGQAVPDVLQSGDHERIRRWRLRESLARTLARRPELLEERVLTREEAAILEELRGQRSDSTDSRN